MIKNVEAILLFSENPRTLMEFYRDVLRLKLTTEAEMGDNNEELFFFEMKGCDIVIMHHSKITGKNKQPERMMFNLEVDNIEKEVEHLKKTNVKLVRDIYHIEEYGYVATFADIDGNYFQLVKTRQ